MDTVDNILLYTENISKNFQGIKAVNNVNFKIYKKINNQWFIASRVEESSWSHNVPSYINTKPKK